MATTTSDLEQATGTTRAELERDVDQVAPVNTEPPYIDAAEIVQIRGLNGRETGAYLLGALHVQWGFRGEQTLRVRIPTPHLAAVAAMLLSANASVSPYASDPHDGGCTTLDLH